MTKRTGLLIGTVVLMLLALSGCLTRPQVVVSYYTLDYLGDTEDPDLRHEEPYPESVHILDTRVASAYGRPQLVQRGIGPAFVYLGNHLWGIDLAETVADLIERRARSYGAFERTTREFSRDEADYELRSSIASIEYVVFGGLQFATLDLELSLVAMPEEVAVVRYSGRVESPVAADDVSVFVAEVNRLIMGEIDAFLAKSFRYLDTGEPAVDDRPAVAVDVDEDAATPSSQGSGELLLPRLGQSDNQPFYTVRSVDSDLERGGRFGTPLLLPAGRYSVEFGSGPIDLRMRRVNIEVRSRRRTVLEPTWSAMTVVVMDSSRSPVRVRYDIYDAETGESYGGRVSSSEALVSAQRVWVVPPGRYKVVVNGRPFATLQDFVTVNLVSGMNEDLTIIVGADDAGATTALRGAGNIDIEETGDPTSPLSLSSAVNANVSFAFDDEEEPWDFSTLLVLDSEVETDLTYEIAPLRYELSNLVAFGFSAADGAPLRVTSDRFRLRNTLLYELTPVYGLYTRLDAEALLFGDRVVTEEPQNYIKRDGDTVIEQEEEEREVTLSPPFMPLTLREGAGLNVTAFRTPRFDLSLRGGLGATQTFRYQTYEVADSEVIDGETYAVYQAAERSSDIGLEFTAFATVIPPWNTTFTSSAELFVPFGLEREVSLQWENTANVILANNVSLLYRFVLRTEGQQPEARLVQSHGVFLRLNYLLR